MLDDIIMVFGPEIPTHEFFAMDDGIWPQWKLIMYHHHHHSAPLTTKRIQKPPKWTTDTFHFKNQKYWAFDVYIIRWLLVLHLLFASVGLPWPDNFLIFNSPRGRMASANSSSHFLLPITGLIFEIKDVNKKRRKRKKTHKKKTRKKEDAKEKREVNAFFQKWIEYKLNSRFS